MRCCVKNCRADRKRCLKEGSSFHKFSEHLFKTWMDAIGENICADFDPIKDGICSIHFKPNMIDGSRLRWQAVPSYFDNYERRSAKKDNPVERIDPLALKNHPNSMADCISNVFLTDGAIFRPFNRATKFNMDDLKNPPSPPAEESLGEAISPEVSESDDYLRYEYKTSETPTNTVDREDQISNFQNSDIENAVENRTNAIEAVESGSKLHTDTTLARDIKPDAEIAEINAVAEADTISDIETFPVVETNPDAKTIPIVESIPDVETVPDAETILKVETVPDAETILKVETVSDAETIQKVETVSDAETIQKVETVSDAETIQKVETVFDAETIQKVETVSDAETIQKVETFPDDETNLKAETFLDAETDPNIDSISDVKNISVVNDAEATSAISMCEDNSTIEFDTKDEIHLEENMAAEEPTTCQQANLRSNDMQVDDDDQLSCSEEAREENVDDVDMKDIEYERSDKLDDNLSFRNESHRDDIEEESKDKQMDESIDELHDNVEIENLNPASDQSCKHLEDSDSGLNDSVGNEKHHTEEVDMENVESVRDTTEKGAEDPFDTVRNNTLIEGNNESEGHEVSHSNDIHTEAEKDDENESQDESAPATAETDVADGNDTIATEDDIEHGKGIDEELSLLPDAEREISDADKERALQAEEDAAKESTTTSANVETGEVNLIDNDDETNKEIAETPQDDVEIEITENVDAVTTNENLELLSAAPKEGEIKEIQLDLPEQTCLECNTVRVCKYTLIEDSSAKFLCEIECVTNFRAKHTAQQYTLSVKKISILQIADSEQICTRCNLSKPCKYRLRTSDKSYEYLCGDDCVNLYIGGNVEKYVLKKKRHTIEEISETNEPHQCVQCFDKKGCQFRFQQEEDEIFICNENCVNLIMKEQPDRFRLKRRSVRVRDLPKRAGLGSATIPNTPEPVAEQPKILARTEAEAEAARVDREASFGRRCAQCFSTVLPNERSLLWETLDFCNETCLGQFQNVIGAACTTCQRAVSMTSLGKYCVRFGYEIRQFCQSTCLDEFKKGLKVCSYCQKDISKGPDGFLASIGGQFKDFCSQICMKKYDDMCNPRRKPNQGLCSVCNNYDQVRVEVLIDGRDHGFCSNPCFSAFKFVNNIFPDKCAMCTKFFERKSADAHTIYQEKQKLCSMFCTKVCMNIFIITKRQIVPCQWCKVKKYNFDMIEKFSNGNKVMLCSLNCLTLCEVSMNAISMKKLLCDQCGTLVTPQYHLTMSDTSVRNFCTYQCVMSFQSQFQSAPLTLEDKVTGANSPVPAGLPKRIKGAAKQSQIQITYPKQKNNAKSRKIASNVTSTKVQPLPSKLPSSGSKLQSSAAKLHTTATKVPIISNVTSLAPGLITRNKRGQTSISMSLQPVVELEPLPTNMLSKNVNTYHGSKRNNVSYDNATPPTPAPPPVPPKIEVNTQIITVPPLPTRVANMSTMCKPAVENKEILCKPTTVTIGCQTESHLEKKYIVPIPVPIYVPMPMHMYSLPVVTPVPIPLPIPVPVYIPTTRNSANGIMKEIKKIQDKMPTDPFEAELLMMAEMVAGDKKKEETESESDEDDDYGTEGMTENNALGEDMLQIALKMASEYEEPAVDLESAMTASTITPSSHPHLTYDGVDDPIQQHHMLLMEQQRQMQGGQRGRKRGPIAQNRNNRTQISPPNKRVRRPEMPVMIPQPEPPREPVEKADANMCLKFTFGVNAWKQWVMTKNADLEKSSIRRKPFKSELLQLTADELNYSLCLFVKEVRKPNGSEYAPDTIYYLVLGIQQYLYENGRIDNIFTDPYYEKFTDCLDDVAKKFSVLYNDSQYIVTRVEEEHLWECKQLGAHSPHVLLSTLMFFNTKHFNLTTVEEHMQLSFSHIMKHWKRNPNQVGASKLPGSRNVLLRFYPPQSSLDNNSRKKKVYEQQENEENPLRCPVKLYEFYLSKCPESVKTRNDVFYLQPERSCVPDSPVWYSTQALGKESLCKMLHRVKMVKEINIALLTS